MFMNETCVYKTDLTTFENRFGDKQRCYICVMKSFGRTKRVRTVTCVRTIEYARVFSGLHHN